MLAELQGRPIQQMRSGEEGEKERRLGTLAQEVEYLQPRRHRYFCKPYRIDPDIHEIPLLLRDMEDYRQLLTGQTNKILAYLHDYQLDTALNALLAALLRCFEEFCLQGGRMAGRLGKREEGEARREDGEGRCSECLRMLSEYRVQQMREELQLNRFEDHYKLFNVDHLNFQELGRLQRESKALLQGELAQENQFVFQGGCISLEQYEEVLNLLGSDLHQKNTSIEKIIDYLSKTDKRLLGEDRIKDSEVEEMRQFDALVTGDSIQERLREMIRQFFKRYLQYKMYKRKDADCQVNFKENDVIRELQREKKHLKSRVYTITTERQRMATDYQNRLKGVNLELQASAVQFREQMEKKALEAAQTAQLFAEEKHLHDLHKLELEHLTNEYTRVLALLHRNSINPKDKDSHSSRDSKRNSSRKSKKEKPKLPLRKQRSSFAEMSNTNIESDNEMDSNNTLHISKAREDSKKSIHEGGRGTNSSLNETGRMESYSKIEERQEEEENEGPVVHKEIKRKTSRFKALMNHFSSNATLQQEASKSQIERSKLASLNAIVQQACNEDPHSICPPEQSVTCKQSEESRYEMLLRLFENERSSQQLTLPFPNFLQLYNDFITTISSEKLLPRSSSLKPRANRLGSNYEKPAHSRTAKSIDEQLTKENMGKAKVERKRNSSKLEPLDKKSQYCLKKVRKSKQFEFKSYSRTAEQTQRKDCSEQLVSIKDVQIESSNFSESQRLYPCFSDEDFQEMFLGQASAMRVEGEGREEESYPAENKILMKAYAEMASLHIKNVKHYEEVRTVLCHPKEAVARHAVTAPRKENVNELKNALKCVIKLHRKCKKDKGKVQCSHLQKFIAKVGHLCTNTSLKLIENITVSKFA